MTRRLRAAALVCLALAGISGPVPAQAGITLDLGVVRGPHAVSSSFALTNPSRTRSARVDLLAATAALRVEPDRFVLAPGASQRVAVTCTPEGYSADPQGVAIRRLLVKADLPELDGTWVLVVASLPPAAEGAAGSQCDECRKAEAQMDELGALRALAGVALPLDIYLAAGCAECEGYLARELPRAARSAGRLLRVLRHDLGSPAAAAELGRRLGERGLALERTPVAFVGAEVLQGLDALRRWADRALGPR